MVDLYFDHRPVSSIFIIKKSEGFAVYSNRCIFIGKLIFYEDVFMFMMFMFIIDTQIAFFYTSPGFLDHTCHEKDE